MSSAIAFDITVAPEATVARMVVEAKKAGIELHGDDRHGTFAGFNAKDAYSREGNQIHATVLKKPFFDSGSLIRKLAVEKAPGWRLAVA